MSRIINLRSPYFIKVESSLETRNLAKATLFLYIWTGTSTDRPAEPTYTLTKSVNSLQDFIVFDVADYCRDFVEVSYDGTDYNTEPVYIGVEVSKEYSNSEVVDEESQLLWGLDGYREHSEGLDGFFNLLAPAGAIASEEETESGDDTLITPTISMTVNESSMAQSLPFGSSVTFSFLVSPTNSAINLYRGSTANLVTTIAADDAKTYTISNFQASNEGTYFAVASYTNTDSNNTVLESENSNSISISQQGSVATILTPSVNTFSSTIGDSQHYTAQIDAAPAAPVAANVTAPSWLNIQSFNTNSVLGSVRTVSFNAVTSQANTGSSSRTGTITLAYESGTKSTSATVIQSGSGFTPPSTPSITFVNNTSGSTTDFLANSGESFTLTASATDPEGGSISYQWYLNGTGIGNRINGATSSTYTTVTNTGGTERYYVSATSSTSNLTTFSQPRTLNWVGGPSLSFVFNQEYEGGSIINIAVVGTDPAGGTLSYTWEINEGTGWLTWGSASSVTEGGGTGTTASISTTSAVEVQIRVRAQSSASGLFSPFLTSTFELLGSGSTQQNTNVGVNITQSFTSSGGYVASSGTAAKGTYFRVDGTFDSADQIAEEETIETFTRFSDAGYTSLVETVEAFILQRYRNSAGVEYWRYSPDNDISTAPPAKVNFTLTWLETLIASWPASQLSYNESEKGYSQNFNKTSGLDISEYTVTAVDIGDGTSWLTSVSTTQGTSPGIGVFQFQLAENTSANPRSLRLRVSSSALSQSASDNITLTQSGNVAGEVTRFQIDSSGTLPPNSELVQLTVTATDSASWRVQVNIPGDNNLSFDGNGSDTINVTVPSNNGEDNREIRFTLSTTGSTTLASGVTTTYYRTQLGGGVGGEF